MKLDIKHYIHESNLIEGIDDRKEDAQSLIAWRFIDNLKLISQPDLLKLHRLITKNQLPRNESGRYRTINVAVGGRLCPSPFLAQQQAYNWIHDMVVYWNLDPIEMHVRFEKIHCFVDGNGRTGRMLLWHHELKLGRKPTLFLNSEKHEKYYPLFN